MKIDEVHAPMDTLSLTKEAKKHIMEKTQSRQQVVLGKWSTTCKRVKREHFLTPHTKISSKWIKDLNVRPETIKLLQENIGRTLYDINHSKMLHDPPPGVMERKTKMNTWDPVELKSFCTTKETISKVKRQTSEWEKITANETTDKELISKIYTQLMQLNTRKT